MVDLATMKPTERSIEIIDPSTELPVGIRVDLVSIDDERLTKIKRGITDAQNKLAQRGKYFKSDELEANTHRLIFEAMLDWHWYNPTGKEGDEKFDPEAMPTYNGKVPDFTQRNVYEILENLTWFKKQIIEEIEDEKAFFTKSGRN